MKPDFKEYRLTCLKTDLEDQLEILNKVISSFRNQSCLRFGVPRVLTDAERETYLVEEKIKAIDEIIKGLWQTKGGDHV